MTDDKDIAILQLLLSSSEYLSGEKIAQKLNLSRTAVWKRINRLRKTGYIIASGHRQGYRLVSTPDKLLPSLVKMDLKTSIIGRQLFYYPQIDSTNRQAKIMASQGVHDGTLVFTEHQTQGQGRLKRKWVSPPGKNLLFSIIFYPSVPPPRVFQLTLLSSLSVCKTLVDDAKIEAGIKWPNDIYVNNRKICGVLTEFSANQDRVNWAVVGIGINVNFDPSSDPEIAAIATSIKRETGKSHNRIPLLQNIVKTIEEYYNRFLNGDVETIKNEWLSRSIILGKPVTIISDHHEEEGIAETIDENGALILRTPQGKKKKIVYGDLSLRMK